MFIYLNHKKHYFVPLTNKHWKYENNELVIIYGLTNIIEDIITPSKLTKLGIENNNNTFVAQPIGSSSSTLLYETSVSAPNG